ncbi:MAG: nucleotide-binding protein [Vulcanimicrobiaceae bacterium]
MSSVSTRRGDGGRTSSPGPERLSKDELRVEAAGIDARMVNGRARAIMVLGTGSDVGKSMVVAALCRLLADAGVRVAPFKAQNMSLNSAATPEGLEIGRAQALQAQAARVMPSADMNPVLLKPGSDTGAQAIVQGRIAGRVDASEFGGRTRERFWPAVVESYERLARAHDVIVLEGAGSVAEINLRDGDIVNMAMATKPMHAAYCLPTSIAAACLPQSSELLRC